MSKKVIRFGIVGPGVIANKFANAVAQCDDVVVQAVASRNEKRGAEFAQKHNIPTVYNNYEDIMNDAEVDAIYIAVPHNFHADIAMECIRHKKAVLCEKPYGINLKQAQEIVALAQQEQVLFTEAVWTRFLPAIEAAHQWIKEGLIGEVKLLESSFSFCAPVSMESRLFNRSMAGGALLDTGIYCIAFALDFGGELESFSGMASIGETGVDEIATLQMRFKNGVLASNSCGIRTESRKEAVIHGTKGSIRIPEFWGAPEANLYDGKRQFVKGVKDDQTNGFVHEVNHFADLLREGKIESPRMPWADTVCAATVYDTLLAEWGLSF